MAQETPSVPFGRGSRQRLVTLPLALLAAVVLAYLATQPLGGGEPQPSFFVIGSARPGIQIGQIAPGSAQAGGSGSFGLTDLDGDMVALADFADKPIWLIFWKTACDACEAEAADVAAAYAAHRDDGLIVIGVDVWDSVAVVHDYTASHPFDYPIAVATTPAVMDAYGLWGAPTHYFIDPSGVIRDRYFGPMTPDLIDESLRRII